MVLQVPHLVDMELMLGSYRMKLPLHVGRSDRILHIGR